jgi:hypothetical protein
MITKIRFRSLYFFRCAALLPSSTLAAALTVLALTGCASWQETAANNCLYYGYSPGTDGFASCAQSEMMAMRYQYENAMDRWAAASAGAQTPAPQQ